MNISLIERDKKRRRLFFKHELKRIQLKSIIHNTSLSPQLRWDAVLKLSKLPRNSSKTRIKNRCILTGRSKSVYKNFKLSRITFREFALGGMLPGISKYSW